MKNFLERIARRMRWRSSRSPQANSQRTWDVLDAYVRTAPSPANAVEIFSGSWASKFPPPFEQLTGGRAALFEDHRITWALEQLGDVRGARVLELGPLEGGHSYMFDRAGAAEVVAIEGNTRAFLRCLVAKELLGMPAAHFLCGDFMAYLQETHDQYDLCVASGVLYHMQQPIELLARIAEVSSRVLIWSHYYDEALLRANSQTVNRVVEPIRGEYRGFRHHLYRYEYGAALDYVGFCGGSRPFAYWLSREDMLGALRHFGFGKIEIGPEQPDHPHGPAFTLIAWK